MFLHVLISRDRIHSNLQTRTEIAESAVGIWTEQCICPKGHVLKFSYRYMVIKFHEIFHGRHYREYQMTGVENWNNLFITQR